MYRGCQRKGGGCGWNKTGVFKHVCICMHVCRKEHVSRDVCGGMCVEGCVEGGHVYVCVEGGKNDAAMRLKVYTALLLLTDGGYYSEIRHHVYILICITILTTGLKEQDSTLIPRSHGAR